MTGMERTDWLEEGLSLFVTLLAGAPRPWKMANPAREYDWGSTGALAALQGRGPSGRPEAELWMGAHPAAPSRLRQPDGSEVSLAAAIRADPAARGGPRTPAARSSRADARGDD